MQTDGQEEKEMTTEENQTAHRYGSNPARRSEISIKRKGQGRV